MYVVTLPESAAEDPSGFAKRAQAEGADILEIRTDVTPELSPFSSPLPLLVAVRGDDHDLIATLKPQYVDIEGVADTKLPEDITVIRSYHDFERTPSIEELAAIAQDLIETGAEIIKIATTINSYTDVAILDQLHERIPSDQQRVILGMGVRSHVTRMLSPFKNALTYTYLEEGQQAASGQVPLSLHQLTEHCKQPKVFGILGHLDVQSGSPLIHNTLFHEHDIDAIFTTFLSDDLDDTWDYIVQHNVAGLSVTTPFKQTIIPKLHQLDPLAEELRSVNTAVLKADVYLGHNKDEVGVRDGYPVLKQDQHVCILGSGGVVPAVIHACQAKGVERISVLARNPEACAELARTHAVETADIAELATTTADIVICAINADIAFDLPDATSGACAIDLRYGQETQFLRDAKQKGYTVFDGVPMLLRQALGQFECFTGVQPTQQDEDLLCTLYPTSHGQ